MKRKLLFAMLCIVGALNASAQEDVTATYLKNADFSEGVATTQDVPFGTVNAFGDWRNLSDLTDVAAGLFTYGKEYYLGGEGTIAPAKGPDGNAGNAFGLCAVNGLRVRYAQDVTLPAGSYTVRFQVYNASTDFGSGKIIQENLFGFEDSNHSVTYHAADNTFAIGQWTTVAVSFKLTAETEGEISMGYQAANKDNVAMPHLFVDNVKIIKNSFYSDLTENVGVEANTNWINATDGMQGSGVTTDDGRNTKMAARYGNSSVGTQIYQDVTGLENGSYEVVVFAYSQMEWKGGGDWLTHDAGDAGYVFANDETTYINARRGPGYPVDGPGIYTISDVKVTDGTMKIGYALALPDRTEWHAIQIKSLIYTNGLSLADYEASVKEWKDKIRAITALPPKYLEHTTALLNAIYDTYSTVSDYEYAIQTLSDLYDQAKTMEELYAQYTNLHNYVTALLAVPYVEKVDGAHAALEAANVEPGIQYQQDAYTAIFDLNHAAWTYAKDADPAANKQFDLTFFLVNPDVTKYWDGTWGIKPEGWLTDQTTNGQNFQVMQNDRLGPGGEVFMEYWSGSPAQDGFVLYQQVNLPSGTYKMTGRVAANFDNQGGTVQNVFFAANDVVGTPINSETLMDAEVEFTQDIEDIVKIGMIATEGNEARWMGINGIHLYKMGEKEPYRIEEWTDYDYTQSGTGDVYLLRDIKSNTYNTMVLPFNMNKDEIEQVFGIGTHVYLAERFTNNNISLRTPGFGDNSINEGQGEEKITANVPFVILPTLVDSEWSPNGVTIPGRTLVPSETVNPSYTGDKVTMLGNYASSYQVPQVGMVNWVIGYSNDDPTGATTADGTAYMPEAKLYYVNSEVTLATTYCHFALEGATEAKAIGFDVEGEATGIAVVDNGDVKFFSGKAYDLSGREVKNPSKGLYIIGGKKVMIK